MKFRILHLFLAVFIAVAAAPVLSTFVETAFNQSVQENTRALWYDEAYIVEPARAVWKGGPTAFRCFADYIGVCYGGGQVALDALLLKLFATDRHQPELESVPGLAWPWQVGESQIYSILRLSRLSFAIFILATLIVSAFLLKSWLPWHLAFWLGASPAFLMAWQGAKNDYPSTLVGALFMYFALKAFTNEHAKGRDWAFVLALLSATFCLLVRPWIVPPLGLFLILFPAWERWFRKRIPAQAFAIGISLSLVLYLLFSPNAWHSLSEATWLKPYLFFAVQRAPGGFFGRVGFLLFNLVPFLPPLLAVMILTPQKKKLLPAVSMVGLMLLLMLGSPFQLAAYILAPLTLMFVFVLFFWKELPAKTRVYLEIFCAIFGLIWILCTRAATRDTFLANSPHFSPAFHRLSERVHALAPEIEKGRVALDLTLHAPLPRLAEHENAIYFDSLSLEPEELVRRLKPEAEKVLVACWAPEPMERPSPAAEKWAEVTRDLCRDGRPLNEGATIFYQVPMTLPERFAVISREELKKRLKAPSMNGPTQAKLSPRTFIGGEWIRNYFSIVSRSTWLAFFDTDTKLSLLLPDPASIKTINWDMESFCSEGANLTVNLSQGEEAHTFKFDLANGAEYCERHPIACKVLPAAVRQWAQIHGKHSVIVPLARVRNSPLKVTFSFSVHEPCYIISNAVRFEALKTPN